MSTHDATNLLLPWETVSPGRLHASIRANGLLVHLTALRVEMRGDTQEAWDADDDEDLGALYALAEPGDPFEVTTLPGQEGEWIVYGTPGS